MKKRLRKLILITCVSVIALLPHKGFAFSMKCNVWGVNDLSALISQGTMNPNVSIGAIGADYSALVSIKRLDCISSKGNKYILTDFNIGPELYMDLTEDEGIDDYTISCPLVSENRLRKVLSSNKSFRLGGIRASAGVLIVAGKVGVSVNQRGALCFLAGHGEGFGGGASLTHMTIRLD